MMTAIELSLSEPYANTQTGIRRELRMTLVAYFSASGVTAGVAETLAKAANADLYEIKPETPYTRADLNWNDPKSRSTLEMKQMASRPAITGRVENMAEYTTVYIGFPIWWYIAPTIINTFLESYDFKGKKIILFATSGGSGMGRTQEKLRPSAPGAEFVAEKRLLAGVTPDSVQQWIQSIAM